MSAFLSGEMKDTVQMNPAGAYGAFSSNITNFTPSDFLLVLCLSARTFLLEAGEAKAIS